MMCAAGQPVMVAPQAVQALEKDPRSWMRVCLSRGRVDANKFDTVKNGEGVLHVRTSSTVGDAFRFTRCQRLCRETTYAVRTNG